MTQPSLRDPVLSHPPPASGYSGGVIVDARGLELSEAWQEGDRSARWRSAAVSGPGLGTASSGSSYLEIDPGARLPAHIDTAEETIVVLEGLAEVVVADEGGRCGPGGVAVVPRNVRHEVRSVGDRALRFMAVYASAEVETIYETEVQPAGSRRRRPVR